MTDVSDKREPADDVLRDLAKDVPWDRPNASRRDAIRSSLLVEAAESNVAPSAVPRRWLTVGSAFVAGALAAAAVAVIIVRRDPDRPAITPAQITASPNAKLDHQIVTTATGVDEIVNVRDGKVSLAVPAVRRGDHVRVHTKTAEVEGDAGELEVVVVADSLETVTVRAGTARVVVTGQAPVFLSAGQTWRSSIITTDLSPTPDRVAVRSPDSADRASDTAVRSPDSPDSTVRPSDSPDPNTGTTDQPDKPGTNRPTDKPGIGPTDKRDTTVRTTDKPDPTVRTTDKAGTGPTDKSGTNRPTDKSDPTVRTTDKLGTGPTDKPDPTVRTTDKAGTGPTDKSGTNRPTDKPGTGPMDKPDPTVRTTDKPGTGPTDKPGTNRPTDKPGTGPTDKPGTGPTDKSGTKRPTDKPGTGPTDKPGTNRPTDKRGTNRPADKSDPTVRTTDKPGTGPTDKPGTNRPTDKPDASKRPNVDSKPRIELDPPKPTIESKPGAPSGDPKPTVDPKPDANKPTVIEPAKPDRAKQTTIEQQFRKGWELLRAGKAREAAIELGAAADAMPESPLAADARYWQAVALIRAGQPRDAERVLVQFLDNAPRSLRRGRAAVLLGRVLAERGDRKSATAWYESAIHDPDPAIANAARAGLQALQKSK